MNANIDKNAKIIWDYMHMNHEIEKSDAIFVLCSHDTRVAARGAKLFLDGYGDCLIFSGGFGNIEEHRFIESEAETFAKVARSLGVPPDKIIIENKSSNSGENIRFTYELLNKLGKHFTSFILVQKPYMERRAYATFKKQWPDKSTKITVTSSLMPYEIYFNWEIRKDDVLNIMVGDLQRIKEYPAKGYQIPQEIPPGVWDAYEMLIKAGYTTHLIENSL